MNVVTVPWCAVPAYGLIVGPDGAPVTVLPAAAPMAPYRALKDAAGVVRVVGIDPCATVRYLVPDLGDAIVALAAQFKIEFLGSVE